MKAAAMIVALIAITVTTALLAGLVIEERYQSCIAKAEARTPVYVGLAPTGVLSGNTGPRSRAYGVNERRAAVGRCRR